MNLVSGERTPEQTETSTSPVTGRSLSEIMMDFSISYFDRLIELRVAAPEDNLLSRHLRPMYIEQTEERIIQELLDRGEQHHPATVATQLKEYQGLATQEDTDNTERLATLRRHIIDTILPPQETVNEQRARAMALNSNDRQIGFVIPTIIQQPRLDETTMARVMEALRPARRVNVLAKIVELRQLPTAGIALPFFEEQLVHTIHLALQRNRLTETDLPRDIPRLVQEFDKAEQPEEKRELAAQIANQFIPAAWEHKQQLAALEDLDVEFTIAIPHWKFFMQTVARSWRKWREQPDQ